ncbi:MAG: ferrous iron transport protein B [Deltaproteobacteria bacterium]|jgi:ferrous iron transport protein B|nr:ferrous iron transport protein B [Deltaproteobacteria bacterium]
MSEGAYCHTIYQFMKKTDLKIAIAGNPNAGKTTVFNALTGTRQHVANYPGVTVEKKSGLLKYKDMQMEIVDLPGTYSLTAASEDERVARNYIIHEKPDVVVDVIDASNFERNAYLTSQLLELGVRLVVVLNMSDRAKSQGQILDIEMIKERLGCEVVETVGSRGVGIGELKDSIARAVNRNPKDVTLDYGEEFGAFVDEVTDSIAAMKGGVDYASKRWIATKLLEYDPQVVQKFTDTYRSLGTTIMNRVREIRKNVEGHHRASLDILFAERRYGFAAGLYREILRKEPSGHRHFSDSVDDLVTHRFIGIPLFLGLMYLVFYVTFTFAGLPMEWIENGVGWLGNLVATYWPGDGPIKSLVVDGAISGVGGVLVFLPNILLLFMCISILEDSGYMARVAFIMDKLMHKIGLHGKSFIPMVLGFGCSVPAIMATRTLENRRDRLTTMLIIPLMSCGAKLPIYTLFIPAFFPMAWRPRVLWLLYLTGVMLAILLIRILRSSMLKGESTPFVMELPPYRVPTLKGIIIHMWERSKLYLKKAGTIILAVSIVMWFLTSYPKPAEIPGAQEVRGTAIEYSFAGRIGHAMEPAIKPLGFDWRIGTALIGAMAAKEVFVSQLAIIFSLSGDESGISRLTEKLRKNYTPLIGICVMLFCLISFPCMATIVMTKRESGSWKWAIFQLVGLTMLAYLITLIVYQVGIRI